MIKSLALPRHTTDPTVEQDVAKEGVKRSDPSPGDGSLRNRTVQAFNRGMIEVYARTKDAAAFSGPWTRFVESVRA